MVEDVYASSFESVDCFDDFDELFVGHACVFGVVDDESRAVLFF